MTAMLLENRGFFEAARTSLRLINSRRQRYLATIALLLILLPLLKTLLYILILGGTYLLTEGDQTVLLLALYEANWRAEFFIPLIVDVLQIGLIVVAYCGYVGQPIARPVRERRILRSALRLGVVVALILLIELAHEQQNPFLTRILGADELPRIVAHRAGGTFGQENSLEALADSRESGIASGIEIDVQLTRDEVVVLHHDAQLTRVTGQPGTVGELDYAELARRPTRMRDGSFSGPPLPTLEQALDAAGELEVMIELKESPARGERLAARVIELVQARGMGEQISLASMDRELLRFVKARAPELRTVLISAILLAPDFSEPYIDIYSIESRGLNRRHLERAHERGKQLYVWTVNSDRGLRRVLQSWPDGIITDNIYYADYAMHSFGERIPLQNEVFIAFADSGRQRTSEDLDEEQREFDADLPEHLPTRAEGEDEADFDSFIEDIVDAYESYLEPWPSAEEAYEDDGYDEDEADEDETDEETYEDAA